MNGNRRIADCFCYGSVSIYWYVFIGCWVVRSLLPGYQMRMVEVGLGFSQFGDLISRWLRSVD